MNFDELVVQLHQEISTLLTLEDQKKLIDRLMVLIYSSQKKEDNYDEFPN